MRNVDLVLWNEVRPWNSAALGSMGADWASVSSRAGADRPCPGPDVLATP